MKSARIVLPRNPDYLLECFLGNNSNGEKKKKVELGKKKTIISSSPLMNCSITENFRSKSKIYWKNF